MSGSREAFEAWASMNVGQPDFGGYHTDGGRWFYRHNFIRMCWDAWQAALAAQQSAEHIDPVVYRIIIRHWHDGQLDVSFEGVGDEPDDLKAIAFALRRLADDFERGNRGSKEQ